MPSNLWPSPDILLDRDPYMVLQIEWNISKDGPLHRMMFDGEKMVNLMAGHTQEELQEIKARHKEFEE